MAPRKSKGQLIVHPQSAPRQYLVESQTDPGKSYQVNLQATPYTCECTAFAINKNRAKNKQPGLAVTCKHIDAVRSQFENDFTLLSIDDYDSINAELKDMLDELKGEDVNAAMRDRLKNELAEIEEL